MSNDPRIHGLPFARFLSPHYAGPGEYPRPREASLTEGKWIIRLTEALGDLAAQHQIGAGAGVDDEIDRTIRLLSQWRSERAS